MRSYKCVLAVMAFLMAATLAGCGSGMSSSSGSGTGSASVFTVATDSPTLPSVVSFTTNITNVTLLNTSNNSVSVLSQTANVDFARLSGLHQLIDLNPVPTGTYTMATISLSAPVIGYIDTTKTPPVVTMLNGNFGGNTTTSVTVALANPFTLNSADLVGLRMELNLAKSLTTDGSGNLTGAITPAFNMQLLNASDSEVSIDDFRGGVAGVTGGDTFTMQGPHGRLWNVVTNQNTDFDTNEMISSFTTNTIVEVSGQLDPVTKNIDCSELAVISNDKFAVSGLFTSIRPPSGPATAADVFVREEVPDISGVPLGQITTLTLNGSETYKIANIQNPLTTLLFNNSALTAGQTVTVGGALNTSSGVTTLIPHRIVLNRQGQSGPTVVGSVLGGSGGSNNGSFKFTDNAQAGILLPSPLTVITGNQTHFINLSGLSALAGSQSVNVRVVGFILVNAGTPVMVARSVEELPAS
jgi:hypothetical protein